METPFKTLDDIKDFSLSVVSQMVIDGLLPDCTDTDDDTEFQAQDIITEMLCNVTGIKND
jgi:hypothetical protein